MRPPVCSAKRQQSQLSQRDMEGLPEQPGAARATCPTATPRPSLSLPRLLALPTFTRQRTMRPTIERARSHHQPSERWHRRTRQPSSHVPRLPPHQNSSRSRSRPSTSKQQATTRPTPRIQAVTSHDAPLGGVPLPVDQWHPFGIAAAKGRSSSRFRGGNFKPRQTAVEQPCIGPEPATNCCRFRALYRRLFAARRHVDLHDQEAH